MTLELHVQLDYGRAGLDVRLDSDARSVGIFGPSGAGKTTLLEVIAGWRRPRVGRVVVAGEVLLDTEHRIDLAPEHRGIGYVPQDGLLFPHWTVARNLASSPRSAGGEAQLRRVIEVLELAPLLDSYPAALSGGERQRVALGRALASAARILLLDEPLGALDVELRRRVLPFVVRAREAFDVPLLFVSHDPTEVQATCEHVVVLQAGRIAREGRPCEVLSAARLHATSFENVLRGAVEEVSDGTLVVRVADDVTFRIPRAGAQVEAARAVLFGLRADDILLSREPVEGVSARNRPRGRLLELVEDGTDVHARVELGAAGPELWVSLTPEATRELDLAPRVEVHLLIKTQSCHRLA